MPRTRKPAGQAVDPRNGRRAELVKVVGERFDPPAGLCEQATAQWDAYWDDPIASVHTPADRQLLLRWVKNVDRYWRLITQADLSPVTSNSQGQVANPLYGIALKVESSIKADEAQLGIGPKNRAALGIAVIQEQRSLQQMNAEYGGGDEQPPEPSADPRVIEG